MRHNVTWLWTLRGRSIALLLALLVVGISPLFSRPEADTRWFLGTALAFALVAQGQTLRADRQVAAGRRAGLGEVLMLLALTASVLLVGELVGLNDEVARVLAAQV
jgi:hypothetical protein